MDFYEVDHVNKENCWFPSFKKNNSSIVTTGILFWCCILILDKPPLSIPKKCLASDIIPLVNFKANLPTTPYLQPAGKLTPLVAEGALRYRLWELARRKTNSHWQKTAKVTNDDGWGMARRDRRRPFSHEYLALGERGAHPSSQTSRLWF